MTTKEDRLADPYALALASQRVLMSEAARLIAHDLSQPLAAIVANAGACSRWLRRDPPEPAEAEASLQAIARDARAAGEAMRGIESFLRLRMRRSRPLDLGRIFEAAVAFARPGLEAAEVRVDVSTIALEQAPVGDDVQVFQVVSCLLDNALDAVRANDGERRITLAANSAPGGMVETCVRDNGPGVAPATRDHMFEAFHTTKPESPGLGLAIARAILDSHGGRIWLDEAAPAPGATFRFTLPARAA